MKLSHRSFWALLILAVSIVLSQAVTAHQAITPKDERLQVIASFKQFINLRRYIPNMTRVEPVSSGWVNCSYTIETEYQYDITTTNSIVTPYVAQCEFVLVRTPTASHTTQEEARKDMEFNGQQKRYTHRHLYALREGNWITTQRRYHQDGIDGFFECGDVPKDGPKAGMRNPMNCFEAN